MSKHLITAFTLLTFVFSANAQADIIGSQAFNAISTPNLGSLDQSFSLSSVSSNFNQSGDFTGLPLSTAWGSFSIGSFASNTVGDALVISNGDFGIFSGVIIGDTGALAAPFGSGSGRLLYASGTWTPGTNAFFGGDTSTIAAEIGLTFVKSSSGSTIGTSLVMDTNVVPEPLCASLIGLAGAGLLAFHRRRI